MKITTKHIFIALMLSIVSIVHAGFKPGQQAPGFALKDLAGKSVTLDDLVKQGHVLLVFWESECVYCFMHVKDFNAIHEQYQGKGLSLVAINFLGEHEDAIKSYVDDHNIKYMLLTDRGESIDAATAYKVIGSPTLALISPDKKILYYGHKIPDLQTYPIGKR